MVGVARPTQARVPPTLPAPPLHACTPRCVYPPPARSGSRDPPAQQHAAHIRATGHLPARGLIAPRPPPRPAPRTPARAPLRAPPYPLGAHLSASAPPAAAGPRVLPAPRPRLADERDHAGDAARAAAARGGAALCARARRRRRGEGVRQDLLRRAPASRRAQRPAQPRPDLRGAPAVRHQQGGGQGGRCAHPHTPRAPPPRPACVLARAARRLLPSAAPDRAPRARSWPRCCL